jgi:hypothetical protein
VSWHAADRAPLRTIAVTARMICIQAPGPTSAIEVPADSPRNHAFSS